MPELITRYPNTTIKLLKEANINCGVGDPQKVLVNCPKERFCSLPNGGELCVFGIKEVPNTMQINTTDLFLLPDVTVPLVGAFLVVFAIGVLVGRAIKKAAERNSPRNSGM